MAIHFREKVLREGLLIFVFFLRGNPRGKLVVHVHLKLIRQKEFNLDFKMYIVNIKFNLCTKETIMNI